MHLIRNCESGIVPYLFSQTKINGHLMNVPRLRVADEG